MNPPTSRRDRPPKAALTRDGIIAAALAVLRAEGLDRVTMRRVAAELDTGAASLYVYVRDAADLHAQLLDALVAPTARMPLPEDWRAATHALLDAYGAVLGAHPELARVAMSTVPTGPNYLALLDRLLGLLRAGGVADREAAWAVDLLLLHVTAHAVEHAAWAVSDAIEGQFVSLAETIRSADAATHPNIARIGDELLSGASGRLRWQLDVLLNGVCATPRSSP